MARPVRAVKKPVDVKHILRNGNFLVFVPPSNCRIYVVLAKEVPRSLSS